MKKEACDHGEKWKLDNPRTPKEKLFCAMCELAYLTGKVASQGRRIFQLETQLKHFGHTPVLEQPE